MQTNIPIGMPYIIDIQAEGIWHSKNISFTPQNNRKKGAFKLIIHHLNAPFQ